jgi:hypothetical protein
MSRPKSHDDSDEPQTMFEWQRRSINNPELGGEGKGDVPPMPASSPWAASIDEICGVEPTIDRSAEDADHFVPTPPTEGD